MQVMKHNQRIVSEPSQLFTQGRNIPVSCGTSLGYCPGRKNIHPLITCSIPVLNVLFENPPSPGSLNQSLTAETLQLLFVLSHFAFSFCLISPTLGILYFQGLFGPKIVISISCTIPGLPHVLFHPQRAHLHSQKNTDRALGIF